MRYYVLPGSHGLHAAGLVTAALIAGSCSHQAPQDGRLIRKVHVMVGNQVEHGQPLVEIESVAAGDAHG